jgi:type I restriction-modification system DNA methylase subunit
MSTKETSIKEAIQSALAAFVSSPMEQAGLQLFEALGYRSDRRFHLAPNNAQTFISSFAQNRSFNPDQALVSEWQSVDFLFQLTDSEIQSNAQGTLVFDSKDTYDGSAMQSYLFFAIDLKRDRYTRTQLASITRAVNRLFDMPALLLFRHGDTITLSIIHRRLHKRDESKDVLLKKVTLIKDINIADPHRAHIEILYDLSFTRLFDAHHFTNFVQLSNAWKKTLDISELNKRFYRELANWYFWAMDYVSFPDDVEKDRDIRNATSLIRLITRIIFIWFIKEKGLVPEALFDRTALSSILKAFVKDKTSSNYYRAILQNLYFGTLNQKMDERGFAKEGSFPENRSNYGVKNLFRYADLFAISEAEALNLFRDIPFLNGGLFDCLDKENEEGKVLYADGFSRNPKKQAIVPDFLFFGVEEEYDLNEVYGTKNKHYKVLGLIELLSRYKFTVAENTPIEEEVALDPELLGKAFENLLASYNPETKSTARKQTGSFYTPREIVDYMVDESVKAYLKGALVEGFLMKEDDAKAGLDLLFEYTEKEHLFDETETQALINAIDKCKILDPACGSGAFPMGVLHKMVHILHKLDPNNEQWKQRQINKVDKLIEDAQGIPDSVMRGQVIAGLEHNKQDIEDAFESNELDYGRKLYLIENCIYGVDIQPIAVQIAKLRFFISLIIDQRKQPDKDNFSIRSLPNLETKFVAANTVIGLDKPRQMMIHNPEIDRLEGELKRLRHVYFTAKTRREKLSGQKKDRELRNRIAELLEKDGWGHASAEQVAAFDPYDQNASSPFFDPEWMFGLTDGFDVVIGNPPYFNVGTVNKDIRKYLSEQYKVIHTGYNDIVYYFIFLGIELLNRTGCCVLITSNYYLGNEYAKKLRSYLGQHVSKIVNFKDHMVFEAASIHTCISISRKEPKSDEIIFFETIKDERITSCKLEDALKSFATKRILLGDNWVIADGSNTAILDKIKTGGALLGDISTIEKGSTSGKNNVFTISCAFAEQMKLERSVLRKNIKNGDVERYVLADRGYCLIYVDNNTNIEFYPNALSYLKSHKKVLSDRNEVKQGLYPWYRFERPRNKEIFDADEKIVVPYRAENNRFAYDDKQYFNDGGDIRAIVINDNEFSIKYVLGVLNSSLMNWFYGFIGKPKGKAREYFNAPLALIPIKKMSLPEQQPFINVVDAILYAKLKNPAAETSFLESLIDAMVYELYFPEEIKSAECEVLKHLTGFPEVNGSWSNEQKFVAIEKSYKELSDPTHPVSVAMTKMQDLPEVRIIEGRQ